MKKEKVCKAVSSFIGIMSSILPCVLKISSKYFKLFGYFLIKATIGNETQEGNGEENMALKAMYKLCCLNSKAGDESENEEKGDFPPQPKVSEDFLFESTFHRR